MHTLEPIMMSGIYLVATILIAALLLYVVDLIPGDAQLKKLAHTVVLVIAVIFSLVWLVDIAKFALSRMQ